MTDCNLLGPWIRRFLLEHLVVERNFARSTQLSYRDTLTLLVPFVSRRCKVPIDRLSVGEVSPTTVRQFLEHVERERHCSVVTRNQRLGAIPHSRASSVSALQNTWPGARRSAPSRSRRPPGPLSDTSRSRSWRLCCKRQTAARYWELEITRSSCSSITPVLERMKRRGWPQATCSSALRQQCESWERVTNGGSARFGRQLSRRCGRSW